MWSNSVCLNLNGFVALRASRLSSNSLRAESETRDSSRSSFSWKLRLFRHGKPSKMMQNAIKYSGPTANLFCKCCLLCLNIMEYCLPFVRSKSKALVDPQNQRTPLEMTKPLNLWNLSDADLPPRCCPFFASWLDLWLDWFTMIQLLVSYYIYVIIVHMSSHSVWHVLNCSGGWNWRKLLIIHSSGLKPMDSQVPFWYHWQGISRWSKTTCQPFQHSEAPPSLVSQNLLSIVNDILKSLKVWQSCFRPPQTSQQTDPIPI